MLLTILAACLPGCDSSEHNPSEYHRWRAQSRIDESTAQGAEYGRSIIGPFEALRTPIPPGCEAVLMSLKKVTYILALDADGEIVDVRSDATSEVDVCMRGMYAGSRLPPPPSAPFLLAISEEGDGSPLPELP
ncbi:MAG: hypothetical protein HYV17_09945 [Xanthomonadales bacterium]|nr:hypothetical protein [Xanthomonadales bacterium]